MDTAGLHPHRTIAKEVASILAIVERELVDAQSNISADWRFACNAALTLALYFSMLQGFELRKTRSTTRQSALYH
jgi:hypothetical protein